MIKTFALAAAALVVAAPAVAGAETFKHKGVEYNYTTEQQDGEQVLRGTAYSGKVPFELRNSSLYSMISTENMYCYWII